MTKSFILFVLYFASSHIGYKDQELAVRQAVNLIKKETGIVLSIRSRRTTWAQYRKDVGFGHDASCSALAISCRKWKKGQLNLIVDGPMRQNGHNYFMGYAEGICRKSGGAAYVGILRRRGNGGDGRVFAKYAVAHELLHLLGSRDNSSSDAYCPLDWTGLLYCVDSQPVRLSDLGKQQVNKCVR